MAARSPSDDRPHVVVLGAGYGGLRAATAARRHGARVTLVDATGMHEFGPRLAAVASGRAPSGDGWAPIEELLGDDVEVVRSVAAEVDSAGPSVLLDDGQRLRADGVVVATGAESRWPDVEGARELGQGLRTVADALSIRRELVEANRLIVVGGGATGVQLAGEAIRRHRHLDVTILEAAEHLLPGLPARVGDRAARILGRRGVDVRRRTSVQQVTPRGVVLDTGSRLDGFVVWATGFRADGAALLPGCETHGGRIVVDASLRVPGTHGVFACGDVAALRDLFGQPLAMSAQVAVQSGGAAGRNAALVARGVPPTPAILLDLGTMVTMGRDVGVGRLGPIGLASPWSDRLVPLLHDAIDLRHLLRAGGVGALLRHAPGRHRPARNDLRRVERPQVRSVG